MTTSEMVHRALLGSIVLFSCVAPSPAAADPTAFIAPDGLATVVFIQNGREDRQMQFTVFDLNKRCIAQVGGREAEVVVVKPGKHTLYITGYDTHRIDASLAPGRTYFIRLYTIQKAVTRVSRATPIQRGSDAYKELGTWLRGAQTVYAKDDPCSGNPLKERTNRTQKRIDQANADWKTSDNAAKADNMLIQSDGLTPTEVAHF